MVKDSAQDPNTIHLIFNPKSGKKTGATLREIAETFCAERGLALKLHELRPGEDFSRPITDALQELRAQDVLVVAGGDGTVRAVAHHARALAVRMAVIPTGTFNWFARDNGIPEDALQALALAVSGTPVPVDLAEVNGETFILNVSFGSYAASFRERRKEAKKHGRSRLVAALATLRVLFTHKRSWPAELTVDARKIETDLMTLFVSVNELQLQRHRFKNAADLSTKAFVLLLVERLGLLSKLRLFWKYLCGTHDEHERFSALSGDAVSVRFRTGRVEAVLDGETFTFGSHVEIRALPGALQLMTGAAIRCE